MENLVLEKNEELKNEELKNEELKNEELKNECKRVLKSNLLSIEELEKKIENGGNKKSIESVICGIKKNIGILKLIIDVLSDKEVKIDLIKRLEYNKKVELKEVSKEEVIKNDLLDKVIIKKVNGVNKYFISE